MRTPKPLRSTDQAPLAILTEKINKHLEDNAVLTEEQEKCRKDAFGYASQLSFWTSQ